MAALGDLPHFIYAYEKLGEPWITQQNENKSNQRRYYHERRFKKYAVIYGRYLKRARIIVDCYLIRYIVSE